MKELRGIRLSSGTLRAATIEKTTNREDYKVSFHKAAGSHVRDRTQPRLPEAAPIVINDYSKPRDPLVAQATELVQRFHRAFHGIEEYAPQSKEASQVLSLVSRHGLERAKHIVDFAHAEAAKTNFQIQHFGAVLSYAARALAER